MIPKRTILIAEDDKRIRNNLADFLLNEGFDVIAAANGSMAFLLALEASPDLIISDVHMPVMNGLELLEKVKEDPRTSLIPVIILTSDVGIHRSDTGIPGGAAACILKPFMFSEILRSIGMVLP